METCVQERSDPTIDRVHVGVRGFYRGRVGRRDDLFTPRNRFNGCSSGSRQRFSDTSGRGVDVHPCVRVGDVFDGHHLRVGRPSDSLRLVVASELQRN